MSEAQLQRILRDNERLAEELKRSKEIQEVSKSSKMLIEYTQGTMDPFLPQWKQAGNKNAWQKNAGGGCCVVS